MLANHIMPNSKTDTLLLARSRKELQKESQSKFEPNNMDQNQRNETGRRNNFYLKEFNRSKPCNITVLVNFV